MRCMKGVYENTDEDSPFRRRPDSDLLVRENRSLQAIDLTVLKLVLKLFDDSRHTALKGHRSQNLRI